MIIPVSKLRQDDHYNSGSTDNINESCPERHLLHTALIPEQTRTYLQQEEPELPGKRDRLGYQHEESKSHAYGT